MRLLIVASDKLDGQRLRSALHGSGFDLDWAADMHAVKKLLSCRSYVVVVLGSGAVRPAELQTLFEPRNATPPPCILSLCDGKIVNRIAPAAAHDASDPRSWRQGPRVAAERVERILHDALQRDPAPVTGPRGPLLLDQDRLAARRGGEEFRLSPKEFRLLAALVERQGAVMSRPALTAVLCRWGEQIGPTAIEAHIASLRRKLGAEAIESVRGVGVRLNADAIHARFDKLSFSATARR
jgi:DNA-binding response OmpR family regulator